MATNPLSSKENDTRTDDTGDRQIPFSLDR